MTQIRPGGSGRDGAVQTYLRGSGPRSVLVFAVDADVPAEFEPLVDPERTAGHAAGWTCTLRRDDAIVRNPLGEGLVRATIEPVDDAWRSNVHHDGSALVVLVPAAAVGMFGEMTVAAAVADGTARAATVRCDIDADHGKAPEVGRNEPCPCASGKKFKHCHGR